MEEELWKAVLGYKLFFGLSDDYQLDETDRALIREHREFYEKEFQAFQKEENQDPNPH